MKFFKKGYDGGPDSGVTGYWLVESKRFFSIVLLQFDPGSRDAFHSHAFNALTWWIKGRAIERFPDRSPQKVWYPSFKPKYTPRDNFHKVLASGEGAWAISFRGPWQRTWQEQRDGETYSLTHGRLRVDG